MNYSSISQYSMPNKLLLSVWFLFFTLISVIANTVFFLLANIFGHNDFFQLGIIATLVFFLISGITAFYMLFRICKCDFCAKPVVPCESWLLKVNGSVSNKVICGLPKMLNIIKHKRFSCYYCGSEYRIRRDS